MKKMITGFLVGICAIAGVPKTVLGQDVLQADENTLALWHFNQTEGTTLTDAGNGGFDGTVSGAEWVEGIEGNALQFSEDGDKVEIGDLDIENMFSIECWIFPEDIQEKKFVFQKMHEDSTNYSLFVENGNLTFMFHILTYDWETQTKYPVEYTASYELPSAETWYYVGVEWLGWMDNSRLRLYVNGELVDLESAQFELGKNDNPLIIGWESSTGSFKGKIDEMRISDDVRGELHYQQHYAGHTSAQRPVGRSMATNGAHRTIRLIRSTEHGVALGGFVPGSNYRLSLYGMNGATLSRVTARADQTGTLSINRATPARGLYQLTAEGPGVRTSMPIGIVR